MLQRVEQENQSQEYLREYPTRKWHHLILPITEPGEDQDVKDNGGKSGTV